MKWVINAWVVGIPWFIYSAAAVIWNIYFNIDFNKWWAQGNFFLIGNTLYIIIQVLVSAPLMFEIPPVLRHIKPIRMLSIISALIYNTLYFIGLADWFFGLYAEEKDDFDNTAGPVSMFL